MAMGWGSLMGVPQTQHDGPDKDSVMGMLWRHSDR